MRCGLARLEDVQVADEITVVAVDRRGAWRTRANAVDALRVNKAPSITLAHGAASMAVDAKAADFFVVDGQAAFLRLLNDVTHLIRVSRILSACPLRTWSMASCMYDLSFSHFSLSSRGDKGFFFW